MPLLTLSQLENHLWKAADILRGSIDSGDYKHYILAFCSSSVSQMSGKRNMKSA
ncbi:type I restriction-modification system, M subunit [Ochrobactrum sp. CDB2]|nr:type I restriction-modification system, M subunit [Ochrobactrum sp. CDB2]